MNIKFGYCYDEPEKINKSFSVEYDLQVRHKENQSVEHPHFIIDYDGDFNVNYCYIPDYNRYYFCHVKMLTGFRKLVECDEDYLKSFAEGICNQTAIVDKVESSSQANVYLNDGDWVTDSRASHEVIQFTSQFNESPEYILICAGGEN